MLLFVKLIPVPVRTDKLVLGPIVKVMDRNLVILAHLITTLTTAHPAKKISVRVQMVWPKLLAHRMDQKLVKAVTTDFTLISQL